MKSLFVRFGIFFFCIFAFAVLAFSSVAYGTPLWIAAPFALLVLLGIHDLTQKKQAVKRNYPIIGNMRYLMEAIRPEIRQYFLEGDQERIPFSREDRAIVYQRASNIPASKAFGTLNQHYSGKHEFISHSIEPVEVDYKQLRVSVGGPGCTQPYSASILNISGMSFGALSANAIKALGAGAKDGDFYLCTGEGGLSEYHMQAGNDVVYQIGSGYFGCRNPDGTFNAEKFALKASLDSVKMIEIKLSQGAKPGHGGVLPASKVTAEIAHARGIEIGQECVSPARHSAFNGPSELMMFIKQLRDLSQGKPVGIKLCVGKPVEAAALVKAMLHTGIMPDFITIDGAEGGTGAAPKEYSDHVGMPLRDGLVMIHNLLKGAGIRKHIRLAASGKVISAFDIVRMIALGADWVNSARGFMFSLGCIQAQDCSNKCPTGIATQDPLRQRALVVEEKAPRVANFHRNTLISLAEILGSAGISSSAHINSDAVMRRVSDLEVASFTTLYTWLHEGELINGLSSNHTYSQIWAKASHEHY